MIVFDSSAVFALLKEEPGAKAVWDVLSDSAMSTVNAAEVYTRASAYGIASTAIELLFGHDGLEIVPFSLSQAAIAGRIAQTTSQAGLSLGDRACLALASEKKAEVLTADRAWVQFAEPLGLSIKLIR